MENYKESFYEVFRLTMCILGIVTAAIVVDESLKKWNILPVDISRLWIVSGLVSTFLMIDFMKSDFYQTLSLRYPKTTRAMSVTVKWSLVVMAILIFIALPFLWFGVIQELAGGS